jgi:catechol 2,3-dioxygenase
MKTFRLPSETSIAFAHLQVADIRRSLEFYGDKLGFQLAQRHNGTAALAAGPQSRTTLLLTENPQAEPKPPHTTGLYHLAIRLPNRIELGRVAQRLLQLDLRFVGAADHGVSEALYTVDPDANGLELYADRPRSQWPRQDGQVAMGILPLDLNDLLNAGLNNPRGGSISLQHQLPPQTDIGHVHLQVSNLEKARFFYDDLLGLRVTQSDTPGALFLAAGDYHHHRGLNTWAGEGAASPPPTAVGLLSFGLRIPSRGSWMILQERLYAAGIPIEAQQQTPAGTSVLVRDPDANGVELVY